MKSKLFKMAWAVRAKFETFAEALKFAWKVVKLSIKMKSGSVSFSFKKVDGSIRKAIGTLKDTPATVGSTKAKNYGVFNYFDIESNGWRSFQIQNLID